MKSYKQLMTPWRGENLSFPGMRLPDRLSSPRRSALNTYEQYIWTQWELYIHTYTYINKNKEEITDFRGSLGTQNIGRNGKERWRGTNDESIVLMYEILKKIKKPGV